MPVVGIWAAFAYGVPIEIFYILLLIIFGISFLPLVLYLSVRFRNNNIIKSYFVVVLITLITLSGMVFFTIAPKAKNLKKQRIEAFSNAQMIKAHLPTTLKGKWRLINNHIESGGGMVKVEYSQTEFEQQRTNDLDAGHKWITMAEIVSPKTDLKCNVETLLELDKMVTVELPISDKRWLMNCEELSIPSEKAILSGYDEEGGSTYDPRTNIKPYHHKELLMVFDKESTRIFLYYEQYLQDYLMSTENWSKNDLIRVTEGLRPINEKDFGL